MYNDDIIRAEVETMVRQRYTLMSRGGTKSRDVRRTSYRYEEEPTRNIVIKMAEEVEGVFSCGTLAAKND